MSVLVACENIDDRDGFINMEAVDSVSKEAIETLAKRRILGVHTRTYIRTRVSCPMSFIFPK